MQAMANELPMARETFYKMSPFFQLNQKGYRKNWANTRLCEYRPMQRFFHTNSFFLTDWFWRFHVMKFNVTFRPRLKYFKLMFAAALGVMIQDHFWAREYRSKAKFH